MSINATNMYDLDRHIAEIYDRSETYQDDVELLLSLILSTRREVTGSPPLPLIPFPLDAAANPSLSILEPFCGTGRILIPLAEGGHCLTGLDQAAGMLERLRQKLALCSAEVQSPVVLAQRDVITGACPSGFELVVLGGNCLYELATLEEQEQVIRSAAAALKPGGFIYVDKDHMEGVLDPAWQQPGVKPSFPSGLCADGTQVESTIETIWFDAPARLVKFRRITCIRLPGSPGEVTEVEVIQQKHPVSAAEVQTWLEKYGFVIDQRFGDRAGNPYIPASPRAIFWAHLSKQS